MNPVRTVLLVLGIALVVLGAYMLYFEAGLQRWVSLGVVTAGLLILVGLIVMGVAGGARIDRPMTTEREVVHERPQTRTERIPEERETTYERRY